MCNLFNAAEFQDNAELSAELRSDGTVPDDVHIMISGPLAIPRLVMTTA
jgi:hypothetical protein